MKKYDITIVGCGPAGIFTAYKLVKSDFNGRILMIDKGYNIERRICPMRDGSSESCVNCKICGIMSGFGGAGAFSDCKLSLYPVGVGGNIVDYVGEEKAIKLAKEVDDIFSTYDADSDKRKVVGDIGSYNMAKSEFCNQDGFYGQHLDLTYCPTKHLGTDGTLAVMHSMFNVLNDQPNIDFMFNTEVKRVDSIYPQANNSYELTVQNTKTISNLETIKSGKVVLAPGRVGNSWMKQTANRLGIEVESGSVDIGVRVETDADITENVTDMLYDMKFHSFDPFTGYKVRTFCTNPNGFVSEEKYDDCAVVNGHSFANTKSNKTNFAILVNITDENFKPEDAVRFMDFVNSYSEGKPIVTNAIDFIYSDVVTDIKDRLKDGVDIYDDYTLKSAKYSNFANIYPSSVYNCIANFMRLLDTSCMKGLCGPKTWIYGPEIKFYSNKVKVDNNFESDLPGLYCIGDGAGITRGIIQSAASGLVVAEHILNN